MILRIDYHEMRIDFLSQFHQSTALAVYKLPSSRCCVILSTAISSSHWHLLQVISWCLPLSFWALEAATFIKSSSIAIAEKRFHKLKDNGHFHLRLSENGHPEDTFRENGLLRDTLCFLLFIKISIVQIPQWDLSTQGPVLLKASRMGWAHWWSNLQTGKIRFSCALDWHYWFALALFVTFIFKALLGRMREACLLIFFKISFKVWHIWKILDIVLQLVEISTFTVTSTRKLISKSFWTSQSQSSPSELTFSQFWEKL